MTQTTGIYGPDTFTVTSKHGNTVEAKYLTSPDGSYIINPLTNTPYVVPVDYDPVAVQQKYYDAYQNFLAEAEQDPSNTNASEIYSSVRVSTYAYLVNEFKAGGPDDLQRSYDGIQNGDFVPAFKDAASFNLGIATQAVQLTKTEALAGGGLYNELQSIRGFPVDTSGSFGNNPDNATSISNGFAVGKSGILQSVQPATSSLSNDNIWNITQYDNGVQYRELNTANVPPNTNFAYDKEWWIPNGDGTYTTVQIASSTGNVSETTWAGLPNQSDRIARTFGDTTSNEVTTFTYENNQIASTTTDYAVNNNKDLVEKIVYPDGHGTITVTNGGKAQFNADGSGTVTFDNGNPINFAPGSTVTVADNGGITISAPSKDGMKVITTVDSTGISTTVTDKNDNVLSSSKVPLNQSNALDTIGRDVATVNDALSFYLAIQSGKPVPIVASGLSLANALTNGQYPQLTMASDIAGGVLSILGLENALKNGDTAAALTDTAQAIDYGANAYTSYLTAEYGSQAAAAAANSDAFAFAGDLNQAMPYINIVNGIAHGDDTSVAVGVADIVAMKAGLYSVPVLGYIYAAYEIVNALTGDDDPPKPYGAGHFYSNSDGTVGVAVYGANGGDQTVKDILTNIQTALNQLIASAEVANPSGIPVGLIADRMPSLSWDGTHFTLTELDPVTGIGRSIQYDSFGDPVSGFEPNDPIAHQSLGTQFIENALAREAIAPMWEVQTVQLRDKGWNPMAGYTDVQIAAHNGQLLLVPPAGATTESFNPIALDLDGNGITTLSRATDNITFNVDDSGYLKKTDWINPQDGFLVLDKNYNGSVDTGSDMFSNPFIAPAGRGLAELGGLDTGTILTNTQQLEGATDPHEENVTQFVATTGDISAKDPVFSQLAVWRDANSNGQVDLGETHSLSSLGIADLNYKAGTFTINGQTHLMETANLTADANGSTFIQIKQGILLENSDGTNELIISDPGLISTIPTPTPTPTPAPTPTPTPVPTPTPTPTYLPLIPGSHVISGFENTPVAIFTSTLIQTNVQEDPAAISSLNIVSVGNPQHGNVVLNNSNGTITFTPDAGFFGPGASFTYTEADSLGQVAQGTVAISIPPHPITIQIDGPDVYYPGDITGQVKITDPNNVPYTASISTQPHGGIAFVHNDGTWIYQPDRGTTTGFGGDDFTISVTDTEGVTASLQIVLRNPSSSGGFGGIDPIVLDLHGKGINLTPTDGSTVYADVAGDGYRHQTAWISPDDAFLFFDASGTGTLSSGKQLELKNIDPNATSDFTALQAFDTTNSGQLDANNPVWNKLYVWQDANGNGVVDAGETMSLSQAGITSISLTNTSQGGIQNGMAVDSAFTATMTDGSQIDAEGVNLPYTNQVLVPNLDGTTTVGTKPAISPPSEIDGDGLLLGTNGNDLIKGGDGQDVIFSGDGNDLIQVGNGDDIIYTGNGDDAIYLGDGNDYVTTGRGNDIILGGNGNDAILLGGGNNLVFVGNGNDLIYGGGGNDVIRAGNGDNTIVGGAGEVAIFAGNGNNYLQGGQAASLLQINGNGDDTLAAGSGIATLVGGTGNNTFYINNTSDVVQAQEGAQSNTVQTTVSYTLGDNQNNLTGLGDADLVLTGNGLDNVILGNAGHDTLIGGGGNDTLIAGGGITTLIGGVGDNTFKVYHAQDVIITQAGSVGNHVESAVDFTLSENMQTLKGLGHSAITLVGNDEANIITANDGDDTLVAGSGVATLIGSTGNDTFVINNIGDVVEAQVGGINTVKTSVSYVAGDHVQNIIGLGSAAITLTGNELDAVISANSGDDTLIAGEGIATLIGGSGDDTFVVNTSFDVVQAAAGGSNVILTSASFLAGANIQTLTGTGDANITLTAGAQTLVINANNGNDALFDDGIDAVTMNGGTGNDTFVVHNSADVVNAKAGGTNTIDTSVSYTASANVQILTGLGIGDLTLTGNNLNNVITANNGNDTLVAGSGIATLIGGSGNDTFVVNNTADVVQANVGGSDTIQTSVSYVAPANVQILTGTGNADISLTAGSQTTTINANDGNDILSDDGIAAITMNGGTGNDTFIVNNVADVVNAHAGSTNTIQTSVSYTASANVQNLVGTGNADLVLSGNDLTDVITANSGNDTLIAGTGIATLNGGAGNDTFVLNNTADVVNAQAGGVNTIQTSVSYVASANVQNLIGTGTDDLILTGNDLADVITANAGNDTLIAGSGLATLNGGIGNDTFIVNNSADVVNAVAGGINSIFTSASFTAPAYVTNLTGTGNADIVLTGNSADNLITGNAGHDTLIGGGGNDTLVAGSGQATLIGGAGNVTFIVNNSNDVVQADEGGINTLQTSASYVAPANVQVLTGTGSADISLTAGSQTTTLNANSGNDTLSDDGFDAVTMNGGAGNDTFIVHNASDVVNAQAGSTNTIDTSVNYTASANVQNLTGIGSDDLVLTGNDLADVITANSGNDTLIAGSGIATLIGGAGSDTFVVNNTADVVEAQAGGINTIQTSVSYTASANVQDLTGTGNADIALTGNNLDNVIIANAGHDTLAGGLGNDTLIGAGSVATTYLYGAGDGLDTLTHMGSQDIVQFGSGLTLDNMALRLATVNGQTIAQLRVLDADGEEQPDQGLNFAVTTDAQGHVVSPIQSFILADGSDLGFNDLLIKQVTTNGTNKSDTLAGNRNDDLLYGGNSNDTLNGGTGHDFLDGGNGDDLLYGGAGNDTLNGGNGNDYLNGGTGDDLLLGGNGNDILQGGRGNDTFAGGNGSELIDAGDGNDSVTAGNGNDWIAGGKGDDTLSGGLGQNVFAFDRGDGMDAIVDSLYGNDTLSLGQIKYADLSLAKSGNDLLVNLGQGDGIDLKDWYVGSSHHGIGKLQVITTGADYDPNSTDKTKNKQVEIFDFGKLVQEFDAARAKNPATDQWAVMNGLLDAYLSSTDTAAIGGDLSFQYAGNDNLSGIGLSMAQAALSGIGNSPQNLHTRSQLEQGTVKLS